MERQITRGLTVAEVVIAVALLGILLTSTLVLFTTLLRAEGLDTLPQYLAERVWARGSGA